MKNKVLSTISILAVGLSILGCNKQGENPKPKYNVGDLLYFGSYAQSEEKDESVINNLNALAGELPNKVDSKSWKAFDWWKSESNEEKFGWYIDIDLDNDGSFDYRGVYFTSYRPYNIKVASSESNSYSDNYGYYISNTYWFKYEPIEWKVLSDDEYIFVMCNRVLDAIHYATHLDNTKHERTDYQGNTASVFGNNYQFSNLRTYLNVSFYNLAFNNGEKDLIKTTKVDNSVASTNYQTNEYVCDDTNDKIFALSGKDIVSPEYGFNSDQMAKDPFRSVLSTDYSSCIGNMRNVGDYNKGCSNWWLRSPDKVTNYSVRGGYSSGLGAGYYYSYTITGVVPAMNLITK